jgi:hypothetical protein
MKFFVVVIFGSKLILICSVSFNESYDLSWSYYVCINSLRKDNPFISSWSTDSVM